VGQAVEEAPRSLSDMRGPGCTRPSTSTDHRIPVSEGGTADWGNLQALCGPHNREKTLAESHRAAKRKAAERKALRYF
jgi:5-methylcytosine-specific restriction endonuclease McrA